METPSSAMRRITRSQTIAPAINSAANVSAIQKIEESEKGCTKSRQRVIKQQDRSALIDITNDSPIVGLAMGKLETPSSLMSKKKVSNQGKQDFTPGSGEALLRCQVKTLLQKVEEEAEISKISSVPRKPLLHLGGQFLISPNGLLAPTPANTPQIFGNPSGNNGSENNIGLASIQESKSENEISPPQAESDKDLLITRSLMLEFSEKSDGSYSSGSSSVMTYQGGESQGKDKSTTEDDSSSIWSIQVNASTKDEHETDEEEIEDETEDNDYYFDEVEAEAEAEAEQESDAGLVDELCEAISKINVNGNGQAKFCGKHTKFVYNSEDELEGEEVFYGESESSSCSGGLRLQGWPTPKGKHIRFPEEALDE